MAKVANDFAFSQESQYPWDQWFDGQTWELKQGEDFTCQAKSFRQLAHAAAKKRQTPTGRLKIQTSILKGPKTGDVVMLKAIRDGVNLGGRDKSPKKPAKKKPAKKATAKKKTAKRRPPKKTAKRKKRAA